MIGFGTLSGAQLHSVELQFWLADAPGVRFLW
jgi:hypothetical protein